MAATGRSGPTSGGSTHTGASNGSHSHSHSCPPRTPLTDVAMPRFSSAPVTVTAPGVTVTRDFMDAPFTYTDTVVTRVTVTEGHGHGHGHARAERGVCACGSTGCGEHCSCAGGAETAADGVPRGCCGGSGHGNGHGDSERPKHPAKLGVSRPLHTAETGRGTGAGTTTVGCGCTSGRAGGLGVTTATGASGPATESFPLLLATPITRSLILRTQRRIPKLGVMVVGLGGNNGTTLTACHLANKMGLTWETKRGPVAADWYGSITQCGTLRLGITPEGREVHVPVTSVAPLCHPSDLVIGGWDISGMNLEEAARRARVLEPDMLWQLGPHLRRMHPLPAPFYPDFVAGNQTERADNVLPGGDKEAHLQRVRGDIRAFKVAHGLDKVVVLWSANTERFMDDPGWDADALLAAIKASHAEVSPSLLFGVASALEGCLFINGSPQNTLLPSLVQLAERNGTFCMGSDFKSGQTRQKAVLVEYLIGAGLKPLAVASYNHLGNNDGKNLSSPAQFRSKEVSKASVLDDMVHGNGLLYPRQEHGHGHGHAEGTGASHTAAGGGGHGNGSGQLTALPAVPVGPDHVVVIKYVPAVGDSKRAIDEYEVGICCGGTQTISIHAVCEDSLLAAPIMLDLVLLGEYCTRVGVRQEREPPESSKPLHTLLSLLSVFLKAPEVPLGAPLVNGHFSQREGLMNFIRAAAGLPTDSHLNLHGRVGAETRAALGLVAVGAAADTSGGVGVSMGRALHGDARRQWELEAFAEAVKPHAAGTGATGTGTSGREEPEPESMGKGRGKAEKRDTNVHTPDHPAVTAGRESAARGS